VPRRREVTFQVDVQDGIPFVLRHVHEHPVTCDARVVDEDVQAPEGFDCLAHQPLGAGEVRDVVVVRPCVLADLVDDRLCGRVVAPLARERDAEVVDHDLRTGLGQSERVLAPDPAPGARDDRDFPLE
jgi:hypothetical protein